MPGVGVVTGMGVVSGVGVVSGEGVVNMCWSESDDSGRRGEHVPAAEVITGMEVVKM